tara:strand:- start:5921 stop:8917 length:2997 start_codon:yes stop_codon:yes gene_type:complete
MNFKEKVRHMSKMGVPANRIIEEKSPYVAKNLAKKYDEETTVFVYVFGAKDAGRLGGGGKYFQDYLKNKNNLKGHGENGYYLVAPHVSISVGGKEVSGTTMRALLGSPKIDDSARAKLFKKMFTYYDKGVFQMMTNKFKKLFEIKEGSLPTTLKKIKKVKKVKPEPDSAKGTFDSTSTFNKHHAGSMGAGDMGKIAEPDTYDWDDSGDEPNEGGYQIKKDKKKKGYEVVDEINIPIKIGDTVLMGKFKNKKVVVKSIDINDKGDLTINGKSASKFRLIKQSNIFNENVSATQLSQVETYLDKLWGKVGIDVEFTRHFMDRANDKRNDKPINSAEVLRIFKQTYKKYGKQIPKLGDDAQAVLKDMSTDVNVPFALHWNGKELELRAKTIMRKKDFKTSNKKFSIEAFLQTIDMSKIIKEVNSTSSSVGGNSQGVDDGPRYFYGNKKTYQKRNEELAGKLGWKVIRLLVGEKTPETYGMDTEYPNGPIGDVSSAPTGIGSGKIDDRAEREHHIGAKAFKTYKKHIDRVVNRLGYEVISYLNAELVAKHSLKTKEIVDEVPNETDDDRNEKQFKGQKVEESLFTKQWWKDLLTEGGAYGHMAHPFDDKDLTFGDLKKIIEDGLGGNLSREDNVTEKLDGQNLMVSWINNKLRIARNKGHIKNFGKTSLDANGIKSKFEGRGNIADAFNFAVKDLEKAINSLSTKQQDKIFNNGKHWMNLEVMWPKSSNVIDYDVAQIVFHGALIYDDKGNVRGEVKGSARILAGMIQQRNQNIQKKYSIGKPNFLTVPKHQDFGKLKSKFLSQLDKLKNQYALKDTDTLALYHQSYWEEYIYNAAKQFGYDISDDILVNLTKRWAFFDKSYKIPTIKTDLKDEPKFLEWVLTTEKLNHAKMVKDNMKPFEILFFQVGSEILKNVEGYIAVNPDKAVQSMRKGLSKAITDLKSGGDVKKLDRLKTQLDRFEAIGGMDAIVPSEGIVFKYKGNTYKFTGAFAPVNQIMGLITF